MGRYREDSGYVREAARENFNEALYNARNEVDEAEEKLNQAEAQVTYLSGLTAAEINEEFGE